MVACTKTTSRKVSHQWKVTSMKAVLYNSTDTLNYSFDEKTSNTPDYNMTNEITLNKDGSYTQIVKEKKGSNFYITQETRGYWAFMSSNKSQEFKKNERIKFNVTYFRNLEEGDDYYYEQISTINDLQENTGNGAGNIGISIYHLSSNSWTIKESSNKKLVLIAYRNIPQFDYWGGGYLEDWITDMEIILERK